MHQLNEQLAANAALDDETVARFLQENPGFFERNPDLLEVLHVPHVAPTGAVSLIEKQVAVLRNRERATAQELNQLVEIARRNEHIADRLHMLAIRFMEASNLDEFLDELIYGLRHSFGLEAVAIFIPCDERADERPELVESDNELLKELRDELLSGKPAVCINNLMEFDLEPIFGQIGNEIRSFAILPIGRFNGGVLILGSRDAEEYSPEAGTRFLEKLSHYAGATAVRCLHCGQ